ncbi:hypothetical protein LINGRAPRIM_LOCUS596 [Linum grandiflorum]
MKEMEGDNGSSSSTPKLAASSPATWRVATSPRAINPTKTTGADGNQMISTVQRSSAPMNIPDWSKIYGVNHSAADNNSNGYYDDNNDDEDDEGDDEDDVVPPHEWLAKRLARSQISSFSVCEGMGRTLKGRDLSKVRNAILTKTGFLE